MDRTLLDKIKVELKGDKEQYLNNCRSNYSNYLQAAQLLFPEYYDSIESRLELTLLNQLAIEAKASSDTESELTILEEAISRGIDTPYTYERLTIIYSERKDFSKAKAICQKWFDSVYWKIPNMASGSLRLLKRSNRLVMK
ncbi:hypothetical protein CAP36_13945 [Chitinophagaceae bacterium IBVUCB2]|nr:hypothetical protein CAP36_13945 [Chitinophagaceae bacterium IBVUCB2]